MKALDSLAKLGLLIIKSGTKKKKINKINK